MAKLPSPCIDVCKFRRSGPSGDHCIGCSMTKTQKKMFKALKRPDQKTAFVKMLIHQQAAMGKYAHWSAAYRRKCKKNGVSAPKGA